MTSEKLKEIENRCNKATPGPWSAIRPDTTTSNWYVSRRPGEGEDGFYISCIFNGKEDADFVTHSREDIPKLLNYIKKLEYGIKIIFASCLAFVISFLLGWFWK